MRKILHYYFIDAALIGIFNFIYTYNLISVPQITQFLLADAMISIKTRVVEARSRIDAIVKFKNN